MAIVPMKPAAVPLTDEDIDFDGASYEDRPRDNFPESWRLLDDVAVLNLPDPEYLIAGVLQRKGKGFVFGQPGSGKTTFIAQLMVALATGDDFFGHVVRHPGASVYVGAEDVSGFKVRLRTAKQAAKVSLARAIGCYCFPEAIDFRDPVAIAGFAAFIKRSAMSSPLELVIIDTYAASMPGAAENSSEDTTMALAHAERWQAALDCAVCFVHHSNASGNRERGHSSLRGGSDFVIRLAATDDLYTAEIDKNRNGPTGETWNMKMVPGPTGDGCLLRPAAEVLPSSDLTTGQQKVYTALIHNFSASGATKTQWQGTVTGVSESTFHRACAELEKRGLVKQVGSHFMVTGKGSR